ncbi:MAG: hypothetical protein MI919_38505, partial [Holophagales bacterium]|nr:hypothetical protein [Holophagales bacterium]
MEKKYQIIEEALENLGERLQQHPQETLLFMLLIGAPPSCGPDLESRWRRLGEHRLKVIRPSARSNGDQIARQVFEHVNKSRITGLALGPSTDSLSAAREALDQGRAFELVLYNASAEDHAALAIHNHELEIEGAFLKKLGSAAVIPLIASTSRAGGAERRNRIVDCSRDETRLFFRLKSFDASIDPYSAYSLHLEMKGSAEVAPIDLPTRLLVTAHPWLTMLHTVSLIVVALVLIAIFLIRFPSERSLAPRWFLGQIRENPLVIFSGSLLIPVLICSLVSDPRPFQDADWGNLSCLVSLGALVLIRPPLQALGGLIMVVITQLFGNAS